MGSPLRILHVAVNMNRGGAETLIMNLYRNIDKSKVQFDFLTFKAGVFDEEIRQKGGKIYRIPYVTETGHHMFKQELEGFFLTYPGYRIVHSHLDKMSGPVLKAAKKAKVPVRIAHSHNTKSEGKPASRMYKWYAGRRIKSHATHYFACSQAAADWLFAKRSGRAFILKNGIETADFRFSRISRDAIRNALRVKEDTLVLGHVGRFAPQKNHLFLLDVFANLLKEIPNAVLLLAGDGPLKTEIERKITALNLEEHVKLLGVRNDIHALLQAMDLFIFPSVHEGLPVTLIEAQGAGLPCLVSDKVTKEVDMGAGLMEQLPLTDAESWVNRIIELKKELHPRIIDQGILAEKGYDIRKTATQTQSAYLTMGDKAI